MDMLCVYHIYVNIYIYILYIYIIITILTISITVVNTLLNSYNIILCMNNFILENIIFYK